MKAFKDLGYFEKEGSIYQLPWEVRKLAYDFIKSIDLDEDDRLRSEGKHGMYESDEAPGIRIVVYDDKVIALVTIRTLESLDDPITDDNAAVIAFAIPRNEIDKLISEERDESI